MIDEHTLQKLVDGELGSNQIRSLLRDAEKSGGDSDPGDWKQMAVAFAENQLIQRSFGDFNLALGSSSHVADDTDVEGPSLARPRTSSNTDNRTVWTAVLAASLLIGTALLYHNFASTNAPETTPSFATANSSDPSDAEATPGDQPKPLLQFDQRTLAALAPDHQLNPELLPAAFGQKGQRQVPLYNAKRFDRRQLNQLRGNDSAAKRAWFDQVIPTGSVSDQMVADYEKAGMLVDQEVEFLSGRLNDGRSYMIPYRSVRFTPGQ